MKGSPKKAQLVDLFNKQPFIYNDVAYVKLDDEKLSADIPCMRGHDGWVVRIHCHEIVTLLYSINFRATND